VLRTRFRHARFYITFRCNARCGYCNVWQDPVFFGHTELGPDDLCRALDDLRELGVEYVDFTGGEPALHRQLSVAVRHAKRLGMATEVTTNAIRFAADADDIVPYVDTLNISLDTLSAERYHAIRGTDTLDRTLALVERLRGQGTANLKLISVVTRQSLPGLKDVITFAQDHRIPVYLSPMFEYFAGQDEVRDPARTMRSLRLLEVNGRPAGDQPSRPVPAGGADRELIAAVRDHTHTPYALVNLAFLRHMETLDPSEPTVCGAGSRIVTIGPDGRVLLPCYHEWDGSLTWDRPYSEVVREPEFVRVRDEEVGLRDGCRRCAVFPYLGLAISYRLTSDFLVQAVSEEIGKIKPFLRDLGDPPDTSALRSGTDALLARIDRLRLRPGTHLDELYHFEARNGLSSDPANGPVAVEEILADHAHEDCWRVQRTPHRLVRLLYSDILPALAESGPRRLLPAALSVHLAVWHTWLNRFRPDTGAESAAYAELAAWCGEAGDALVAAGRRSAARSVAALALLTDLPAARLAAWGGLAGHRDELSLATMVRDGLPPERREALAACFGPDVAERLASGAVPGRLDVHADVREPDLDRAATGDPAELAALRALARSHALTGDTAALRALVRSWKAAAAGGDPERAEHLLLAAGLGLARSGDMAARPGT
jgi:MoaA/NifB/PqqE/SkfB family radical SAM enzyme